MFSFLFIYLAALGLSCGMWKLVPWSGIEPRLPALETKNLIYWTTRAVPSLLTLDCIIYCCDCCQMIIYYYDYFFSNSAVGKNFPYIYLEIYVCIYIYVNIYLHIYTKYIYWEYIHIWIKVEESEKADLKFSIQKMKIIAPSTISSWQIDGETMETVQTLFSWAPKSLQMVTAACSLEEKLWPT